MERLKKFDWKTPFREDDSNNSDIYRSRTKTAKTPRNLLSSTSRTPKSGITQEYIITITENRANEVGIAAFNVTTSEITISQVRFTP